MFSLNKCIQGEGLLRVPRLDPVRAPFLDVAERPFLRVVDGKRALVLVSDDEVLVREGVAAHGDLFQADGAFLEKLVDQPAIHVLEDVLALVQLVHAGDLARLVVLRLDPDALGLHADVDVLGDQDHAVLAVFLGKVERQGDDAMVGFVLPEHVAEERIPLDVRLHDESAAAGQRDPIAQELVPAHGIELAGELARVEVDGLVPFLELVDLLQHGDRDDNIVLLERADAVVVMKDDVCVEHEDFVRP